MNFGTAQDRVTEYIDWSGTNAETKIKNWINDTRIEIAGKYNFEYLFTESTRLTDSNNTYAWPEDLLDHLTIFLDDSAGNPEVMYEMTRGYYADKFKVPGATTPSTSPSHIIRKGTDFQIYPDPESGRTITLWYYALPTTLTLDADTDYMMTIYGEVVVFGAALRGAVYLDDDIKIQKFDTLYKSGLGSMITRESGKKAPKQIRFRTFRDFDVDVFRKKFLIT